ncbi:hypothetical protein BLOT_016026 [Blomia tropicalis]|nr:hypothetical protein BLOT_016026 [Blomia tropicalis]
MTPQTKKKMMIANPIWINFFRGLLRVRVLELRTWEILNRRHHNQLRSRTRIRHHHNPGRTMRRIVCLTQMMSNKYLTFELAISQHSTETY